jgi:WD40 repeat protein
MSKDPMNPRRGRTTTWRAEGYSIQLGLASWQEVALLAAIATVSVCLVGDGEEGRKNPDAQATVEHTGPVRSIVFRPDGAMLLSIGVDGSTVLWDLVGKQKKPFPTENLDQIHCAAFSPDNKSLATLTNNGAVALHNLTTHASRVIYDPNDGVASARCLAFSPDGSTLAIGQEDGRTALWDVKTGHIRQALGGHTDFIASLAFSPDGAALASSSGDRSVRLWNLSDGQQRFVIRDQADTVSVLAFSQDGQLLIIGNHVSPTIRLWDVGQRRESGVLRGLAGNLVAASISHDGLNLAAADFYGVITFWDLQTLKASPRRLLHAGVYDLTFAPDGRTLASAGFDATIRIWDCPPAARSPRDRRVKKGMARIRRRPGKRDGSNSFS